MANLLTEDDWKKLEEIGDDDEVDLPPLHLVCSVCGDRAGVIGYGAPACEGCRAFFKRSLAGDLGYACITGREKCPINPRTRTECRRCRLLKCLEVGMSSSFSVRARQRIVAQGQLVILKQKQQKEANVIANQVPRPGKNCNLFGVISESESTFGRVSVPGVLDASEKILNFNADVIAASTTSEEDDRISLASHSTSSSVGDGGRETSSMFSSLLKSKSEIPQPSTSVKPVKKLLTEGSVSFELDLNLLMEPSNNVTSETLAEIGSKLLFTSVHWIKRFEEFSKLETKVQVELLNNAWSDLILLGMVQCWSSLNIFAILATVEQELRNFARLERVSLKDLKPQLSLIEGTLAFLKKIVNMELDDTEFALLKLIAVFDSDSHQDIPELSELKTRAGIELEEHGKIWGGPMRFAFLLTKFGTLKRPDRQQLSRFLFGGHIREISQTEIEDVIPHILQMEEEPNNTTINSVD